MVDQKEIHCIAQSENAEDRRRAVNLLRNNFADIPDKQLAWADLHQLTKDEDIIVRWAAASALSVVSSYIPDKKQAWDDLYLLTQDEDIYVQLGGVGKALGVSFYYIPDKKQAWDNLIQLIQREDIYVRRSAADALGLAFSHMPDKKHAWSDLQRFTLDEDSFVRKRAASALGLAFSHMPDKKQAWDDLIRLTQDENKSVCRRAIEALGTVFPYVSHKKQAWDDLIRITQNVGSDMRTIANHSLGRISIFKAAESENEEDFRNELEKALKFFEIASKEATDFNPAQFCLPFYRSFYTITFKKEDAEAQIQKYLLEARNAVAGSSSKEKLLEAMENLSNALKETQRAKDFNETKCDLNAYRRYCERAADLLEDTEEKAPGATRLIKRGLPIIDQQIKEIIAEIQENSKVLCKQTKDTPLEDLGKEVNRVGQTFPQVRDPIGLEKGFINLWTALFSICAKMPEEERGEACELLKKANDEPYIEDKLPLINMVLSKISSQISIAKNIETVEKKFDEIQVSLKPRIHEELTITVGAEFLGTGAQHVITIPLQEISYPELKKDLEKIQSKSVHKLASLPVKLAEKIKDYVIRNKREELQSS